MIYFNKNKNITFTSLLAPAGRLTNHSSTQSPKERVFVIWSYNLKSVKENSQNLEMKKGAKDNKQFFTLIYVCRQVTKANIKNLYIFIVQLPFLIFKVLTST